jgi:RNA polymerase sigma-70 factor (ECF subfamily)
MSTKADKIKEFDAVINKFTRFINGNIQKFNLPKEGIDPDDVFQEIRIKIWNLLNDEKKIVNYSSYIKKIVDSSVIDHIRKMRRERVLLLQQKHKTISEWKSTYKIDPIDDKYLKKIVSESVESLLESRRKVVKLYLLNLTLEEIATLFCWSRDKTRNLLYRGLSDLKKSLKEKDIEYEIK